MASLPPAVQDIVYEQASPILLKCAASPPIYLLENGEKRWIDTIESFESRGYVWRDVTIVACNDLRRIPDGTPIEDGLQRIVNIEPFMGKGISAALREEAFFKQVAIESGGGIYWLNGYDFCPNFLYEEVEADQSVAVVS